MNEFHCEREIEQSLLLDGGGVIIGRVGDENRRESGKRRMEEEGTERDN